MVVKRTVSATEHVPGLSCVVSNSISPRELSELPLLSPCRALMCQFERELYRVTQDRFTVSV
jgi:hypothetical protein